MNQVTRLGASALLGAVAAFGLAPWGIWPLTIVMLMFVPVLANGVSSARGAVLIGTFLGLGWFGHGLIWIVEPFLVDVARYGWLAPFALLLMALGGGLFWGLGFGIAARFGNRGLSGVFVLILTWSLAEFTRAYLFTGFPWAALAQIWPGTDVALLLAWVGPHGLALATLLATLLPGWALTQPGFTARKLISLFPALGLAMAALTLGQMIPETTPLTGKTIRLIQPNAPQHQKWDPAFAQTFFDRQIAYTKAGPRPDLVVWPETSVPVLLSNSAGAFAHVIKAATGVPVVLGIQRADEARYFNSLIYLDSDGQEAGRYDKHHLVPFGEYVPFGNLAARFGIRGLAAQAGHGFSAGPGPKAMAIKGLGTALPLICYEVVFPQHASDPNKRSDFLLQITNDAWFGDRSGPYQHLAQAQMRAIEQGLPMIRVANTGVSAMIDPWGRITARIPLGKAGYKDAILPKPRAPTLYSQTGDVPVFLLLLFAGLVLAVWRSYTKIST